MSLRLKSSTHTTIALRRYQDWNGRVTVEPVMGKLSNTGIDIEHCASIAGSKEVID